MNIDRNEIRRYLGMRTETDTDTDALIEECLPLLEEAADPRHVRVRYPLTWQNGYPLIEGNVIESRDLAKNLNGCDEVVIMAVTLGAGVDQLIRRYNVLSMSKAAVLQACAAAMTEEVCDMVNEEVRQQACKEGLYTRPRYSPGYGDCSLEVQKLIFSLIDLPHLIGLSLNDSLLMTPFKSVTAFIGISKENRNPQRSSCDTCSLEDCAYRREDA